MNHPMNQHAWLRWLMALGCLLLVNTSLAAINLGQSLTKEIKQAQKTLVSTEQSVASARQKLAEQLARLEREVLALQQQTTLARRLADDKNLSLSQLEQRLDNWRQQRETERHLLRQFIAQQQLDPAAGFTSADETLPAQLAQVVALSKDLAQRFRPSWQPQPLVNPQGLISSVPTLTLGPLTSYWQPQEQLAGLASWDHAGLKTDVVLPSQAGAGIKQLFEQGNGMITFDPTLSRVLLLEQRSGSALAHIRRGGMWAIPILLFAVFAITIALFKAIQLWRLPPVHLFTAVQLQAQLAGAKTSYVVKGMQHTLLAIAMEQLAPKQRDDQLFVALQQNKQRLERWIGAIAITASVSPLLGLLGTVSGMIETFKMMTLFGSGDPQVVSGGIGQALITTELGLVVAIPALIFHAILNRRVKSYDQQLAHFAVALSQPSADPLSEASA